MLDALAGHQELLKQYEDTFGNWKQVPLKYRSRKTGCFGPKLMKITFNFSSAKWKLRGCRMLPQKTGKLGIAAA